MTKKLSEYDILFKLIYETLIFKMKHKVWGISDIYDWIFHNNELDSDHEIFNYVSKRFKGQMSIINGELAKEDNFFRQKFYQQFGTSVSESVKEMVLSGEAAISCIQQYKIRMWDLLHDPYIASLCLKKGIDVDELFGSDFDKLCEMLQFFYKEEFSAADIIDEYTQMDSDILSKQPCQVNRLMFKMIFGSGEVDPRLQNLYLRFLGTDNVASWLWGNISEIYSGISKMDNVSACGIIECFNGEDLTCGTEEFAFLRNALNVLAVSNLCFVIKNLLNIQEQLMSSDFYRNKMKKRAQLGLVLVLRRHLEK